MKRLPLIVILSLCPLMRLSAQVLLYYGGGNIENGYGTNGQILTSYIVLTTTVLQPYKDNLITHVRIGMKGEAKNVTLYFKNSQRDSKPLYSQSVGTLTEGWNDIELATPFTVTAGILKSSGLPEGVQLYARELTEEEAQPYQAQAEAALGALAYARYLDIGFTVNNEEVEPTGNVQIAIHLDDVLEA